MIRIEINNVDVGLVRAICDTGSQPNLIKHNVLRKHGFRSLYAQMGLIGIAGEMTKVKQRICAKIYPWNNSDKFIELKFWVLPREAKWDVTLPDRNIRAREINLSSEMSLADPLFWKPGKIQMLLGIGAWTKIVSPGLNKLSDALIQQNTEIGSVIMGEVGNNSHETNVKTFAIKEYDYKAQA